MKKFLLFIIVLLFASNGLCDSEVTVGGATGAGHIVQDNSTTLRQRPYLNFIGFTVSDANGKTNISGGGASTLTGLTDISSSTATAGRILIADGTDWESLAVSGDATLSSAGVVSVVNTFCSGTNVYLDGDGNCDTLSVSGVTSLTGLNDIGSATATAGHLLIADGTNWESVTVSGDCTLTSAGVLTCTSSGSSYLTGLSDITANYTTSHILIADGSGFVELGLSGDATMTSAGVVAVANDSHEHTTTTISGLDISADTNLAVTGPITLTDDTIGIAISLTGLSDVSSDDSTAGNILVADGTNFSSVALSGDCTLGSDGAIDCTGLSLTDLVDVTSSTATAGRLLIADGTDWESLAVSGDVTITSAGVVAIANGAMSLVELSDVSTATATKGNILVADGTDWESVNSPLFIDLTNSRIGVGTTAPSYPASIGGTASFINLVGGYAADPCTGAGSSDVPANSIFRCTTGTGSICWCNEEGVDLGIGTTAPCY